MFNLDFRDLVLKWLEPDLRLGRFLDFIYSLVKPLKTTNIAFQAFRNQINYKLQFNGQVIYLERYLNDVYDPISRRIFISDAVRKPIHYLYNKLESKPNTYLYNNSEGHAPFYLFNQIEHNGGISFWVNIPWDVNYNTIVITNQIKIYKLAGKGFGFKTIPNPFVPII